MRRGYPRRREEDRASARLVVTMDTAHSFPPPPPDTDRSDCRLGRFGRVVLDGRAEAAGRVRDDPRLDRRADDRARPGRRDRVPDRRSDDGDRAGAAGVGADGVGETDAERVPPARGDADARRGARRPERAPRRVGAHEGRPREADRRRPVRHVRDRSRRGRREDRRDRPSARAAARRARRLPRAGRAVDGAGAPPRFDHRLARRRPARAPVDRRALRRQRRRRLALAGPARGLTRGERGEARLPRPSTPTGSRRAGSRASSPTTRPLQRIGQATSIRKTLAVGCG